MITEPFAIPKEPYAMIITRSLSLDPTTYNFIIVTSNIMGVGVVVYP